MTRRSSTCRSALLMVLPKRRNNLYISILPGVLSVASVRQRLWMARMLMAGAGLGAAGLGAARSLFMGASGAGLGAAGSLFMGASGAGSGASAGASMPSFLIRLWLSRCAQAVALFTSSSPSTTRASPARCTRTATRTCCCAPPWWHPALREDAAAAAEPGDRN